MIPHDKDKGLAAVECFMSHFAMCAASPASYSEGEQGQSWLMVQSDARHIDQQLVSFCKHQRSKVSLI